MRHKMRQWKADLLTAFGAGMSIGVLNGAFVAYHEGETRAKTPYDLMHKLINSYAIKESSLGGEYFKIEGADCPWR